MPVISLRDWDRILKLLFLAALIFRFLVPIYDNPLDNRFSDPGRHWQNGENLLHPFFMSSIDPKLYQLYIYLVHIVSGDKPAVVGVFSGMLSLAMGIVWYRVCRELFPRRTALILGIIISLCPSLTAIYSLFMNETLLLLLLGTGFWLTLRACRKQQVGTAVWAIVIWALACYTRVIALPLALACLWYMLYAFPQTRWRLAGFTLVLYGLLAIPAGWHSYQNLNVVAPFGHPALNSFYYYGHSRIVEVNTDRGLYGFSSPSFYYPIGEPFFTFNYCRPETPARADILTVKGSEDWDNAIALAKQNFDWDKLSCAMRENLSFLFFANSWPDSAAQWGYKWLYYVNFHSRWMWMPLMFLLLIGAPQAKTRKPEMLILCCALGLLLVLMLQQAVVMEGRYRKPLEPLLLISAAILLRRQKLNDDLWTMPHFVWQIYLLPVWNKIKKFNQSSPN